MFTFVIFPHVLLNSVTIAPRTSQNGSQASPSLINLLQQFTSPAQYLGTEKRMPEGQHVGKRGSLAPVSVINQEDCEESPIPSFLQNLLLLDKTSKSIPL